MKKPSHRWLGELSDTQQRPEAATGLALRQFDPIAPHIHCIELGVRVVGA